MKKLFQTYPNISRLILGALLTALALILSGVIVIPIPHFGEYFPFLGTTLVVLAAWFMLRTENKNLSELGFDLKRRNLFFLPLGLVIGIVAFLTGFYARTSVTGEHWNINHNIQYAAMFSQLYGILASAAVQEFIVRGYCFKKLIEMSNQTVAIIISGLVFISLYRRPERDILIIYNQFTPRWYYHGSIAADIFNNEYWIHYYNIYNLEMATQNKIQLPVAWPDRCI